MIEEKWLELINEKWKIERKIEKSIERCEERDIGIVLI